MPFTGFPEAALDMPEDRIVYAFLSTWEYACCGTIPEAGSCIDGTLRAAPARHDDRFAPPTPVMWDRELELLRFDGWSARWAPEDGDPTQPLDVILSWHPDSERTPKVTGTDTAPTAAERRTPC